MDCRDAGEIAQAIAPARRATAALQSTVIVIDAIDLVGIAVLCFKQRFPGGDHENLDDFGAIETARHFIDGLKG